MDAKDLKSFALQRFDIQSRVLPLWQTLAENFYPERADFTFDHNVGDELATNLASSYPVLIRRELANSFSSMLRQGEWFKITTDEEPDHLGQSWLDYATKRLHRLINYRRANFRRATKEGDHDYATFGQTVISVELNGVADGLLFRSWHLRDCAWWEDDEGRVGGLVRKWKPTAMEMLTYFGGDRLHKAVRDKASDPKKMFDRVEVYHFDIPADVFNSDEIDPEKYPWVSVFLDAENNHIITTQGKIHRSYVVPRFQTISGSPYAYSPATVVGLPDARTLQAMTHTLLEAGERAARPPIVATENVIRGDANLYPDGITFVSEEYDEKMGAALRTLDANSSGIPLGMEMRDGIVNILQEAFYVSKIDLPDRGGDMTAYEFSERMKMYRRQNLPLFAPIEHEYNAQLCELAFDIAMGAGLMGSEYDIPESLHDKEAVFRFTSPLTENEEESKPQLFREVAQLLADAAQFDPAIATNVSFDEALRDAVKGAGAPEDWLDDPDNVMKKRQMIAQQQQAQQAAADGQAVE